MSEINMPDKVTIELTREELEELMDILEEYDCRHRLCIKEKKCEDCYAENPLYAKLKAREGKE